MFCEIDCSDVDAGENDVILSYFYKHSSSVDKKIFGNPMRISPKFTPFLDDKKKMRIIKLAKIRQQSVLT